MNLHHDEHAEMQTKIDSDLSLSIENNALESRNELSTFSTGQAIVNDREQKRQSLHQRNLP